MCARIRLNKTEGMIVACIYRSPNSSKETSEQLNKAIQEIGTLKMSHKLLAGDFNYRDIDWKNWSCPGSDACLEYKFIESLKDTFMFQHITEPTRARLEQIPTILDLVITNEEGMVKNVSMESPLGKSDHGFIKFTFVCSKMKACHPRKKYLYHKADSLV